MPRQTKRRNIALQQTMDEFASDGELLRDVSRRLQDERDRKLFERADVWWGYRAFQRRSPTTLIDLFLSVSVSNFIVSRSVLRRRDEESLLYYR